MRASSPSKDPRHIVLLPGAVAEEIRRESAAGLPAETGGVLVGHETAAGTLITRATGPGPRAVRTRSRFRRDGDYAQGEVDRAHRESGGRDDYVGEWHSHPDSIGPSHADRGSMDWISRNDRYQRPSPVMILARRTLWRRWKLEAYRWRDGTLVRVPLKAPA